VNHLDTVEVRVEVENPSLLTDYSKLEGFVEDIRSKLKVATLLDVKVKLVEPFSIKRGEGKVKRVTDLRKLY
jgi:phenylacetate-CoA ligase